MPMKYTAVKNSYNKKARNMILKRNNRRRKIRTMWHCWGAKKLKNVNISNVTYSIFDLYKYVQCTYRQKKILKETTLQIT